MIEEEKIFEVFITVPIYERKICYYDNKYTSDGVDDGVPGSRGEETTGNVKEKILVLIFLRSFHRQNDKL